MIMQQNFTAAKQRIEAQLQQISDRFAKEYPGLEVGQQVDYWPETLGEAENRDTLSYAFKDSCPDDEQLRYAIRGAMAAGGKPDYEILESKKNP